MMQCPVCQADLSPLDIVSRNEHITLCLENGPSYVDYEGGQLVVKKNIPLEKQRKLCPICSKTFQGILVHFKSCALKNDLTPDLMQSYWLQLNDDCKTNKIFPRDLLESYIAKCTREGRVGEQVEFARELLQTIPGNPRRQKKTTQTAYSDNATVSSNIATDDSNQSIIANSNADSNSVSSGSDRNQQQQQSVANAHQVLMQSSTRPADSVPSGRQAGKAKTRLEIASKDEQRHNIELRIERELAASRLKRYRQALKEAELEDQRQGGKSLPEEEEESCQLTESDSKLLFHQSKLLSEPQTLRIEELFRSDET